MCVLYRLPTNDGLFAKWLSLHHYATSNWSYCDRHCNHYSSPTTDGNRFNDLSVNYVKDITSKVEQCYNSLCNHTNIGRAVAWRVSRERVTAVWSMLDIHKCKLVTLNVVSFLSRNNVTMIFRACRLDWRVLLLIDNTCYTLVAGTDWM